MTRMCADRGGLTNEDQFSCVLKTTGTHSANVDAGGKVCAVERCLIHSGVELAIDQARNFHAKEGVNRDEDIPAQAQFVTDACVGIERVREVLVQCEPRAGTLLHGGGQPP